MEKKSKDKVLILANNDVGLYKFRKELISQLLYEGYAVYISLPKGEFVQSLVEMGCEFIDTPLERRGTNPISDFKLLVKYLQIIKRVSPKYILTYTIKPNIYGGIAAALKGIPYLPNVTGLGSSVEGRGILSSFVMLLYKCAFGKAQAVFFQNKANMQYFEERKIALGRHRLLPGSGVNLQYFTQQEYPKGNEINFVFIARIMKEKGIEEYLESAKCLKQKYSHVQFHICGFCEEAYESLLNELQAAGIIQAHGMVKDTREILKDMHCAVLPSYHEGMSNVLLESAAAGRALIASDIPGCRETFENNRGGFLVLPQNAEDLIQKMEQFILLSDEQKREMGINARKYVEEHFSRQIVIDAYMNELKREDI